MDPLAPATAGFMTPSGRTGLALAGRCVVLFLPAAVLALGAAVMPGPNPTLNWLGPGLGRILGLVLGAQPKLTHDSTGVAGIVRHVLGKGCNEALGGLPSRACGRPPSGRWPIPATRSSSRRSPPPCATPPPRFGERPRKCYCGTANGAGVGCGSASMPRSPTWSCARTD